MKRDSQREKVYAWEWEVKHRLRADDPEPKEDAVMTLAEAQEFVNRIWDDHGLGSPPAVDAGGHGRRVATGGRWHITLPKWARTRITILHEVAHALQDTYYREVAPHGPEFVRQVIELRVRYGGENRAELLKTARAKRIRIGKQAACRQPISRREKAARAKVNALRKQLDAAKLELDAIILERNQ